MEADSLALLVDLYRGTQRQGPGGERETDLALTLAGLPTGRTLEVADIGCGTGASTLQLAARLDARIAALDLSTAFLDQLEEAARVRGLGDQITAIAGDMASLPFARASLDLLWSEGAIYNLGFAEGLSAWREFLKPQGVLAVSEITWLTARRPAELEDFWRAAYPGIDTAAAKIGQLQAAGFIPIGYFPLPAHCWLDNFYRPLEAGFADYLARQADSAAAQAVVAEHRQEIALYHRYGHCYSYGFYLARRSD